ncbi:DNA repair protein REV1 [Triticum urartu]|uniref:DNA repair protein REV1 n=1 Tax=Triticum urartu TaxID=4572 RepID=M8AVL7_TRIUA|nr:DNA repair protein REV1 [Triticum urartu]
MSAKNSKLSAQFDADASTSAAALGALFAGVCIFVDGFTVPSSQELKEIMLNNGGRFVNYFSRHTVTHIICTHLPESKMRNMRAFSKGLPVVKPGWVVDSLAENRLLSWVPYQISQHNSSSRKQMKLSAFFSGKQNGIQYQGNQNDENKDLEFQTSSAQDGSRGQTESCEQEGPLLNVEVAEDSLSSDEHRVPLMNVEVAEDSLSSGEHGVPLMNVEVAEDSVSSDEHGVSTFEERDCEDFAVDEDDNACKIAFSESMDNDMDPELHVAQSPDATSRCSDVCGTGSVGSHLSIGSLEKDTAKSSSRSHSTLTDPNFVENYFKACYSNNLASLMFRYHNYYTILGMHSRLHFIGTWRNRYRKRFSNLPGAKSSKGNNDHSGKKKTIIHIDMIHYCILVYAAYARAICIIVVILIFYTFSPQFQDCFFVSVVIRNRPELHDKPVAVCHSDNPKGTAEISSANYPARNYGIKAGMFVRDAKARCPHLTVVPYNFDAYGEVADQFYGILHKYCTKVQVDDYLSTLPIKALPGIGYTVSDKLKSKEVEHCGQLRNISKDALHKDFGKKISNMLWNYCRGIDHSVVEAVQETKSVGAEVNWGVRFNENKDADNFLVNLSKEVSLRLQGCGLQGRTITLKVKTRRKGAGEPLKFMGCGDCETTSRSTTMTGATDNLVTLQRIARQLFAALHVDVKEVRGVGLKMSKLEHADLGRGAQQGNMLKSWLGSSSEKLKKQCSERTCFLGNSDGAGVASHSSKVKLTSGRSTRVHAAELPPLSELDLEVLKNLPPEIISEMNDMYKGELHGFLGTIKGDEGKESNSKSCVLPAVNQNSVPVCNARLHQYGECTDSMHLEKRNNIKGASDQEVQTAHASCSRANELIDTESVTRLDFMPNSLSQADFTVLQELPEDVKADLFNVLPLHRPMDPTCRTSNITENKSLKNGGADDPKNPVICVLAGSSQKWAEQFRVSSSLLLNAIAEQHANSISSQPLSSILEHVASLLPLCPTSGSEEWSDTFSRLSVLLTEYIHLKVDSDIEELYKCFLLLKRFSSASELFLELHNSILPLLQDLPLYLLWLAFGSFALSLLTFTNMRDKPP